MKMTGRLDLFVFGAALLATLAARAAPLPSLPIAVDQTSVSGLSGGAFMAVQFATAHSSIVRGAGVIAGGPYYCAQGNLARGAAICSCTGAPLLACRVAPGGTEVDKLVEHAERVARDGHIDPVAGMARQRIWLFSGEQDGMVPRPVMDDLQRWYRRFAGDANIRYHHAMPAGHAIPTDGYGNACGHLGAPFINNCGFDGVGDMLKWIYGENLQPRKSAPQGGKLIEFDQSAFFDDRRPARHGMADTGYLYVPESCKTGAAPCTVHIAFHGCAQDAASVGDRFVRNAGYNGWADANRMLVLYPQAASSARNPYACWNWWNFNGDDDHYADKRGRQIRAVRAMVDQIAGIKGSACFTATNFEHVMAGRAYDRFFFAFAKGSGEWLGPDTVFLRRTLKQDGPGRYVVGRCD